MNTVKLHDGRELTIDLNAISIKEWRTMFSRDTEIDESDQILARIVGLSLAELQDLSQPDYRAVAVAVRDAGTAPLSDPNFQSGSTSPS